MDIVPGLASRVQPSVSFPRATSPDGSFSDYGHSPQDRFHGTRLRRYTSNSYARELKPFKTGDIKILLLENVNKSGEDTLKAQGYQVESLKSSIPEDQLIEKIKYIHPSNATATLDLSN